ncbi:MAG: ECF transporter S component [Patescibacteria group bacterium]
MIKEQSIGITTLKITEKILVFSALTILMAYLPTVIHSQLITGPLINMALILAVFLVGPIEAVFLGLMPSVLALISGLLPLALAPVVPFIMISNIILIGVYYYLGKNKFGISIFLASFLKFLFLYSITNLLLINLLPAKISLLLASMMGGLQFITATIGGLLAYAVLLMIIKKLKFNLT